MACRSLKIALLSITLILLLKQYGFSQSHEALIYGEITTISKNTYRGHIRWSKSYVLWNDILWAYKEKNTIKQILSSDKIEQLNIKSKNDFSLDFLNLWDPSFIESESSFKCNFCYLKSIQVIGSEDARCPIGWYTCFLWLGEAAIDVLAVKIRNTRMIVINAQIQVKNLNVISQSPWGLVFDG